MLHLLDPDGYRLEDRELFRRRVRERQLVADAILDLADDATSLFAEEALVRIALTFSDDKRLMELVSSAREHTSSDEADAARILAFQAVRTHLSELYRLHRRLLRTRRDDPRVIDLLPRRSGALVITCDDPARQEAVAFVEQWRNELILSRSGSTGSPRTRSPRTTLYIMGGIRALSSSGSPAMHRSTTGASSRRKRKTAVVHRARLARFAFGI